MKILLAEDDNFIREGLEEYLTEFGYVVSAAENGSRAYDLFKENDFDLYILDIKMPEINGLDLLKKIRETSDRPALILTAFGDEEYKIRAFENLADGFIQKPFSLPVLKARIEALRKKYIKDRVEFRINDTYVNFDTYKAYVCDKEVLVHVKELDILKVLIENKNQALTRSQILDKVWKFDQDIPFDRVIDVYIKELRKKLDLKNIKTIRNVGYMMEL